MDLEPWRSVQVSTDPELIRARLGYPKGDAMAVELRYVVCDERACRPTKTVHLTR
jgi:hypothetical protein